MHLMATNIILWFRTLLKESLHEIAESEEEAHMHGDHNVTNEALPFILFKKVYYYYFLFLILIYHNIFIYQNIINEKNLIDF